MNTLINETRQRRWDYLMEIVMKVLDICADHSIPTASTFTFSIEMVQKMSNILRKFGALR